MPTVNMWCAQTLRLMKPMPTEAATMAGYPKIALRENTGMISFANRERRKDQHVDLRMAEDPEEMHPDDGRAARLRVEEMCAEIAVDSSMICAAVSGVMVTSISALTSTRISQTSSGIRSASCPCSACEKIVAMMLIAVPMRAEAADDQSDSVQ